MLAVRVLPGVTPRVITTTRGEMTINSVKAVLKLGNETREIELEVPRGENAPAPGNYVYTPQFTVNKWKRLELAREYTLEVAKS